MTEDFKVGDFVKVVRGPAYAGPGAPAVKGRVEAIEPGGAVMVRVTSGGLWGFRAEDLKRLPKVQGE